MNKIAKIFETLDYGPAPEAATPALAWLDGHGRKFGHFINGEWTKPGKTFATDNPANGDKLAEITDGTAQDVDKAVKAARAAFPAWSALSGYRARPNIFMPSPGICRRRAGCSPCSKSWTTASRSARAATSTFRWPPAISTIMPAGRSICERQFPDHGALWRLRADHSVEFPAADAGLEDRPGARRRQYGGAQTRRIHLADRAAVRRNLRTRRPAQGRGQYRHRRGRDGSGAGRA